MSSRIQKLAQTYKGTKPEVSSRNILQRIKLESDLQAREAESKLDDFTTATDVVTSVADFSKQLKDEQRFARKVGEEYGIADFLVRSPEAVEAARKGSALVDEYGENVYLDNGEIKLKSFSGFETKKQLGEAKKYIKKTFDVTEELLGRKLTDEEKNIPTIEGIDYEKEETKNPMSSLLSILRGDN